MAWFADLAGKAENLLTNLDEQTGAALRNHNGAKRKNDRSDFSLYPESSSLNPKRRPVRNIRKAPQVTETKSNNYNSPKKVAQNSRPSRAQTKESNDYLREVRSPNRSPARLPLYNLHNCPNTLVGDLKKNDNFGLKHRRLSLPCDLEVMHQESFIFKMQNLEVENAMLKNELNVMNREVSELLDRLRQTEDGNDASLLHHNVVSDEELETAKLKLENTELVNKRVNADKESLSSQLDLLKNTVNNLTTVEMARLKDRNSSLELEVSLLHGRNKELEELIRQLNEKATEHETVQSKMDNELRHAQTTINDLEINLERATGECRRLEQDWDAYKYRVKNMLFAKDKEIKALQEGLNLTEDTKMLIDQIESLKDEREELSEAVSGVRGECAEMRRHVEQLEARHGAAERVVAALRDALRDEHTARGRAEAHANSLAKELNSLQMETNQIITSLRSTLREKDAEISRLREPSVRSSATSALNVADYADIQESIDQDKIQYLTQTLVQRQGKIESLLADNNMLRIQMEKLESKYKAELSALRAQNQTYSVQVQDDFRRRSRFAELTVADVSRRIGTTFKRYPLLRVFMLLYMIFLHFWVLTVLFTSTESHINVTKSKYIPNEA